MSIRALRKQYKNLGSAFSEDLLLLGSSGDSIFGFSEKENSGVEISDHFRAVKLPITPNRVTFDAGTSSVMFMNGNTIGIVLPNETINTKEVDGAEWCDAHLVDGKVIGLTVSGVLSAFDIELNQLFYTEIKKGAQCFVSKGRKLIVGTGGSIVTLEVTDSSFTIEDSVIISPKRIKNMRVTDSYLIVITRSEFSYWALDGFVPIHRRKLNGEYAVFSIHGEYCILAGDRGVPLVLRVFPEEQREERIQVVVGPYVNQNAIMINAVFTEADELICSFMKQPTDYDLVRLSIHQ